MNAPSLISISIFALLLILVQPSNATYFSDPLQHRPRTTSQGHPRLDLNVTSGRIVLKHNGKLSISVLWDQTVQDIVTDLAVGPTIASAAFVTMHTAIYDAWSAYHPAATSTNPTKDTLKRPPFENTEANKRKAMSFAAYHALVANFPTRAAVARNRMKQLGYDPTFADDIPSTIGKLMAEEVFEFYNRNILSKDNTYRFSSVIEFWTPEHIPIDDHSAKLQQFLTPDFGRRCTFGVTNGRSGRPPAPEMFLHSDARLNFEKGTLTFRNGRTRFIDRSIIGPVINPAMISQAEEVIDFSADLNDRKKLMAEVWEAGAGTSFPPGMWLTFGQWVSARDSHSIDDDAKMFLALSNALSDAAITTWNAKYFYSYARPVRAVRDLGRLGLIGEYDERLGGYAITAYNSTSGRVERMLAEKFNTYQVPNSDPSPPFPEYTSGHSAFSSSAAEVLKRFCGSDYFGASVTLPVGSSRFEPGRTPKKKVTFRWKSFTQAANEAGISRLHGGIHFRDGNINGLRLGRYVGKAAYLKAKAFFHPKRNHFYSLFSRRRTQNFW